MAITLEEAKKNVQDDLQMGVIDEFQKSNFILEHIPFDDAVSPTGGGATPSYSYVRLKTQPKAEFRAINTEYTSSEVTKEPYTVEIKVFGGAYEIDRVIANMGGIVNEVELQQAQKIKAAQALFNDTFINGDTAKDTKAFDGLDKALTGSSTEYNTEGSIDLSTSELVTKNYQYFLDMLDEFLGGLDGTPTFIAGNNKLISKLRACARRASMYQATKDNWGNQVESYGGIPFVDLKTKPGTNDEVVPIKGDDGTTSLYVARLAMDGLHAVSFGRIVSVRAEDRKEYLENFTPEQHRIRNEWKVLYALAHSSLRPEFSIEYTVADVEKCKNELLHKAIEDSIQKAQVLTTAANVKLGEIQAIDYSWGEIDFVTKPLNEMRLMECTECEMSAPGAYDIDIEADDINVTDTATVIWEIA